MKNTKVFLGVLVLSFMVGGIAYSAYEGTANVSVPQKTLSDFQKEYSGTKPIAAIMKYYEYLSQMPKTTLMVNHIR